MLNFKFPGRATMVAGLFRALLLTVYLATDMHH
jgi:hypothetical protein